MPRLAYSHRADPPRPSGHWVKPPAPRPAAKPVAYGWVFLPWATKGVRVAVCVDPEAVRDAALDFAKRRDIAQPEVQVLGRGEEPRG